MGYRTECDNDIELSGKLQKHLHDRPEVEDCFVDAVERIVLPKDNAFQKLKLTLSAS